MKILATFFYDLSKYWKMFQGHMSKHKGTFFKVKFLENMKKVGKSSQNSFFCGAKIVNF